MHLKLTEHEAVALRYLVTDKLLALRNNRDTLSRFNETALTQVLEKLNKEIK